MTSERPIRPRLASLLLLSNLLLSCATPESTTAESSIDARRVGIVVAFRAARAAGRLAEATAYLAPDPRVWYGSRSGAGSPWSLEGGRWAAWDQHFRGHTEPVGEWRLEDDRVSAEMYETNDYFALIERGGGYWLASYFFDEGDLIRGFMVSGAEGRPTPRDRREEFQAWAIRKHPEEADYLMPGGSLDPTGDRPPRMRALLNLWRADIGLPPKP